MKIIRTYCIVFLRSEYDYNYNKHSAGTLHIGDIKYISIKEARYYVDRAIIRFPSDCTTIESKIEYYKSNGIEDAIYHPIDIIEITYREGIGPEVESVGLNGDK